MNINDHNNRGFLALAINRAAKKKKETAASVARAIGIHSTTAAKIFRGADGVSMEIYQKVADYLGVPMKPEKSLLSRLDAQGDDFVGIGAATILDALGTSKKLTKEDIVKREEEEMLQFLAARHKQTDGARLPLRRRGMGVPVTIDATDLPIQEVHLPAPIVQNEFTRWQAWVIMGLQVVVIIFLLFPVK